MIHHELFTTIILVIIKICYLGSILFDAWGDAEIDITKKRNHTYELLAKAFLGIVILLTWFYSPIISLFTIISYIPLRMGSFNPLYAKFRNMSHQYVGTTDKWYDKWIMWMTKIIINTKYNITILTIWYILLILFGLFPF